MAPFGHYGFSTVPLRTALLSVVALPRSLLLRNRRCLRCGTDAALNRTHRRFGDRLVGLLVSCRRYRCLRCGWTGLIRDKAGTKVADRPTSRPGSRRASSPR
jgi:hypothetical protein